MPRHLRHMAHVSSTERPLSSERALRQRQQQPLATSAIRQWHSPGVRPANIQARPRPRLAQRLATGNNTNIFEEWGGRHESTIEVSVHKKVYVTEEHQCFRQPSCCLKTVAALH